MYQGMAGQTQISGIRRFVLNIQLTWVQRLQKKLEDQVSVLYILHIYVF